MKPSLEVGHRFQGGERLLKARYCLNPIPNVLEFNTGCPGKTTAYCGAVKGFAQQVVLSDYSRYFKGQ